MKTISELIQQSTPKERKLSQGCIVKSFSFPDGNIWGDMFYIKHNSDIFTVIDCYLKDGDDGNARKEEIVTEIAAESKGKAHHFISTHPDKDHIEGIEYLDEKWPIKNFYAVKNDRPSNGKNSNLTYYKKLLSKKYFEISRGLPYILLNKQKDNLGVSGFKFHWPDLENEIFKERLKAVSEDREINSICPIFSYQSAQGASFMWMGDLTHEMQQEFYDKFEDKIHHIDVLFHPHHGRKIDEPPCELLEKLNPKILVIGNAPDDELNKDYPDRTINKNEAGDIVFINEDKMLHIFSQNKVDKKPKCLENFLKSRTISQYGHYMGTLKL